MASSASARLLDTDNHLRRGLDSPAVTPGWLPSASFSRRARKVSRYRSMPPLPPLAWVAPPMAGYQPVASALLPPAEFSLARSVIGVPSR